MSHFLSPPPGVSGGVRVLRCAVALLALMHACGRPRASRAAVICQLSITPVASLHHWSLIRSRNKRLPRSQADQQVLLERAACNASSLQFCFDGWNMLDSPGGVNPCGVSFRELIGQIDPIGEELVITKPVRPVVTLPPLRTPPCRTGPCWFSRTDR